MNSMRDSKGQVSSERNQSDVPFEGSSPKAVFYQRVFAGVGLISIFLYSFYVDVAAPNRTFRKAEALVKVVSRLVNMAPSGSFLPRVSG